MTVAEAIPRSAAPRISARQRRNRRDRLAMGLTVGLVVVAWIVGYVTSGSDVAPLVSQVLPGATTVQNQGHLFLGYDADGQLVGYAAAGSASGYGGPIEMLVGVDPAGEILASAIVAQRESPGFFRLLETSGLIEGYAGKTVSSPLRLGQDVDAVSGATASTEGVAASIRVAVRQIAADGLGKPLPPERRSVKFGIPEIVLILLFVAGFVGHRLRDRIWKNRIRWGALIGGMVVLGFAYTAPFTITMVVSLISGYWPDWHSNLYWYLLMGGIIFVTSVDAKNPYCYWFCPFGSVQECLAKLSGARQYRPRDYREPLQWLQRGLALLAIVLGLALRRPGIASYEPFATLFDLRGTAVQWAFLVLVLLVSLIIYRPFCTYLCPLDPVVDFIATARRWVKEVWSAWKRRALTA